MQISPAEHPRAATGYREYGPAALLALSVAAVFFILNGFLDLNLADEGYLWYGTQRTFAGEMPFRDFQSYGPARYYWGALWMALFGDGLIALRAGAYAALALGLYFLARAVRLQDLRWVIVFLAVLLGGLWVHSYWKMFDHTAAFIGLAGAATLVRNRDQKAHFLAGLAVGLAAVIGRNHGVYLAGAMLVVGLVTYAQDRDGTLFRRIAAGVAGIVAGYAPMLILAALFPGFAAAILESILENIRFGAFLQSGTPPYWYLIPVVAIALVVGAARLGAEGSAQHPLILAAGAVALTYSHMALSRGHWSHLFLPLFLLLLALIGAANLMLRRQRPAIAWPIIVLVALLSLTMPQRKHAIVGYLKAELSESRPDWVATDTGNGARIPAPPKVAVTTHGLNGILARHDAAGSFFIAPYYPTLYAIHRALSPTWQIYFLVPASEQLQAGEIARLCQSKPKLALIARDIAIDGNEATTFAHTNPALDAFIRRTYRQEGTESLDRTFEIYADPDWSQCETGTGITSRN